MKMLQPTEDEVRAFAYHQYEERGRARGWDQYDWFVAEQAVLFFKNYDQIVSHYLSELQPTRLGNAQLRRCRYCGRTSKHATFDVEAHAIPAFLGNRSLFVNYECDDCNHNFGIGIEDHLAKLLSGHTALLGIRGRRGTPTFKNGDARIQIKDGALRLDQSEHDPILTWTPDGKRYELKSATQPFVPFAAYKCFARMAISIMPDAEYLQCWETLAWVCDPDHSFAFDHFFEASLDMAFTPAQVPDRYGWVRLYRRRFNELQIPFLVMVLSTKNLTFQAYVPLCDPDKGIEGKTGEMPAFPIRMNVEPECGETKFTTIDLYSVVPAVGEFAVRGRAT